MRVTVSGGALVAAFEGERPVLSSAVLGGGLTFARAWLNVTVPAGYARTDPAADLAARALERGLPRPVVGMMTAVDVREYRFERHGAVSVVATVGVRHAIAAAGRRPRPVPAAGTINMLVAVDAALDEGALVGAAQTAVEAKAQALADARVAASNASGWATGTVTDAVCIAALPGASVPFAGPATRVGADIAAAVHGAVLGGVRAGECAVSARGAS